MLRDVSSNAPAHAFGEGRPPHRERSDAARHRQQVLEAAARLFAERGVQAVTMDEIAQAAGVGKGTLYRRYSDKGQLVMALMGACVGQLQDDLDAEMQPGDSVTCPTAESGSALDQLDAVLARLVDWTEDHAAQLGVLSDQAAGDRRGAMHSGPLYQWMHAIVLGLLERANANGETTLDDCEYVADALLAPIDVDLYLFQRHTRGYTPARIQAGLHQLVAGLRST
jgi:AcrR family transcriptional regulator